MDIIKLLLLIILLFVLLFAITPFMGELMKDGLFKRDWLKAYGTIENVFPTGHSYNGIPQIEITLNYEINGDLYHGCALLFTKRSYYFSVGIVVPIKVNPKNLIDCCIDD